MIYVNYSDCAKRWKPLRVDKSQSDSTRKAANSYVYSKTEKITTCRSKNLTEFEKEIAMDICKGKIESLRMEAGIGSGVVLSKDDGLGYRFRSDKNLAPGTKMEDLKVGTRVLFEKKRIGGFVYADNVRVDAGPSASLCKYRPDGTSPAARENSAGDLLTKWAGKFTQKQLEEMAKMIAAECWTLYPQQPYGVLDNYLRYTYAFQQKHGNVLYSKDRCYAAFNVNLPSLMREPLYLLFKKNEPGEETPYRFVRMTANQTRFSAPGINLAMAREPRYYNHPSEKVWTLTDPSKLGVNAEHILLQRYQRIPLEFYQEIPQRCDSVFYQLVHEKRPIKALYAQIGCYLSANRNGLVVSELKQRLEAAIRKSVQNTRWGIDKALPSFYVEGDKASFLLPVALGANDSNCVLLITVEEQRGIQGQSVKSYWVNTLLTKKQAYLNARLVGLPTESWTQGLTVC